MNALDFSKSALSRYMAESEKYEYLKFGRVSYIAVAQSDT